MSNAKSYGSSTFQLFCAQLVERLKQSFTKETPLGDEFKSGYLLHTVIKFSEKLNIGLLDVQQSLKDFESLMSRDFVYTRTLILSSGVKTIYPHKVNELDEINAILENAIIAVINLRENLNFLDINFESEASHKKFSVFYTGTSKQEQKFSYNEFMQSAFENFLTNWKNDVQQLALNVQVIPQVYIEEATDEDRKHDNY